MKEKILNALKSKTFFAFVCNIVIMVLIIGITAFSYDNPDDFYNSLYICQYFCDNNRFVAVYTFEL